MKRSRAAGPAAKPTAGREGVNALGDDGALVTFVPRPYASSSEVNELFQQLRSETNWLPRRTVPQPGNAGKMAQEPRRICYQGLSEDLKYRYSGITLTPTPYSPAVLRVLEKVNELFPGRKPFNTVLLNFYESGEDYLSWHDDHDVKRYGPEPVIASVSFGDKRDFVLRRKSDHSDQYVFSLGGGAALIMHGKCQQTWEHSLPKRKGRPNPRINLTFRHVIADRG